MKVLFINSCVRKESRTHLLCEAYMEKRYSETDEVSELYLPELSLQPLCEATLLQRDCDIKACGFSSPVYRYAKEFAEADEILIGAPYWDCSFPSVLKIYFEKICVNGITFGYGNEGKPLSLCRARRLTYITSAGGYLSEPSSLELYLRELCRMFVIPHFDFYAAQGLDINENNSEKIMKQANCDICRLACSDKDETGRVRK